MTRYRTYKYRLFPDRAQREQLDFLLWQARRIYNMALEQRKTSYEATGKSPTYYEQEKHFRQVRHEQPETLGKLNSTSLGRVLKRLDRAFAAFFRRVAAGETPGYPRFKGRCHFNSIDYQYDNGCRLREDEQGRVRFYVQNVGELRLKFHRPLPEGAVPKEATIKRAAGKWYVALKLALPDVVPPAHPGPAVGIDMGLKWLLAFSDEREPLAHPRLLEGSLRALRVAQRKLSRRQKGSRRWHEAAREVARLQERVANQRRDLWHKQTRALVREYGQIGLEALRLAFMLQNPHLARRAYDAGLGLFQAWLPYKAEEEGTELVLVDARHTSQQCSGCGELVPKALSVRVHDCPHCGLVLDRDVNAARNIYQRAFGKAE